MRKYVVGLLALFLAEILSAGNGRAAEYGLVVGGGNSPARNPASIERQVLQAIHVLAKRKFARIDVLFADGDNPEPDVAEEETNPAVESLAAKTLRRIYGPPLSEDSLALKLRNHRVPSVLGAATKANLQSWFAERGSELKAGDTLLLYFATHGTQAGEVNTEPSPQRSELLLWDGGRLNVSELSTLIRSLPQGAQVQLIITACYAGGFAELGWPSKSAKAGSKLEGSHLPVAGFFATSFDRPAAGCTSAAETPGVHDYATCFWSALAGRWPSDKPVDNDVDLNGDGKISLSEAQAFALVKDTTLDTPLKTSDFALRQISRFGRAEETHLLTNDPYYVDLRTAARPEEQKLLDRLSARQHLTGQQRLSKARTELRRLTFELKALTEERKETLHSLKIKQGEIVLLLSRAFPELSPQTGVTKLSAEKVQQFINKRGAEFEQVVAAGDVKLSLLRTKLAQIDAERLQLEENWAGYQRFLQTAESVILAHNLSLVVEDQAILQRFEALKKAENSPLADTR